MLYRIISKLSFPALYLLSDTIAFILYHIARYRRDISLENLRHAFPDKSMQEIKQIQKSAYLHLSDSLLEILKANTISEEQLHSRVTLSNFEEVAQLISQKKSIFFLTAHTAPTEWVAFLVSLKYNCIIDPVYKPIHSKSLDDFIYMARSRYRATPIPYKKLAKDVILRKQVNRSIAMLADLEPRTRDQALELNFLNRPTRFFLASERVIKLAEYPVFFIGIKKSRRGHYSAYAEKITDSPKQLAPEVLTRNYASCVEQLILDNPAAWLWTHKRWKRLSSNK